MFRITKSNILRRYLYQCIVRIKHTARMDLEQHLLGVQLDFRIGHARAEHLFSFTLKNARQYLSAFLNLGRALLFLLAGDAVLEEYLVGMCLSGVGRFGEVALVDKPDELVFEKQVQFEGTEDGREAFCGRIIIR